MTCNPELIYLYLENELSARESAQVEAHVRMCAACADRLQAQRTVLQDLDRLLEVAMPVGLEQQITGRTYEDLTTTLRRPAEQRRALTVALILSVTTLALWGFSTLAHSLWQFVRGVQVVASVLADGVIVLLKGLSFVTLGLIHDLADEIRVTPSLAVLLVVMLSLVWLRLIRRVEVSANKT